MSYTGRMERNAQPNTYAADRISCMRLAALASAWFIACACVTAMADSDQTTTFTAAMAQSSACHHTTASDVASLVGRAEKFALARASQLPGFNSVRLCK